MCGEMDSQPSGWKDKGICSLNFFLYFFFFKLKMLGVAFNELYL